MKFNNKGCRSADDKKRVQALYNSIAHQYTQNYLNPKSLFGLEKQRRLKILRNYLRNQQPTSVLDLGCGPGYTTSMVADDLFKSTVVGLDYSYEMVRYASQNYRHKVLILQGDAEKLPFESEKYSVVFALGLMEKFQNPLNVFYDCFRVLKPDGYLYFTYPNKKSLIRKFRRWADLLLDKNIEIQNQSLLSGKELLNIVNYAGFKVIDLYFFTFGNSFIMFPWSETINNILEKYYSRKKIGRSISMSCFWMVQKAPADNH